MLSCRSVLTLFCSLYIYIYYIFWECVCSLSYPACNAHAPYYYLWPARLHNSFPQYLINKIFEKKKLLSIKCVFIFFLLFFKTFLTVRRIEWDMIKMCIGLHSCKILMKPEFFRFLKNSNFKFQENPSSGSRVVPCGKTDAPTGMTNLTVACRNFAKAKREEKNIN